MSKETYEDLYGYWRVTTEGDCEGATVKVLGTYKGWLDEIALHLSDKVYYSLGFTKLNSTDMENFIPKNKSVSVTLGIDSGTWDMDSNEREKYVQELFDGNGRKIRITEGRYFASFTINADVEDINDKRRKILNKLSKEEIELLGIKSE